MLQASFLSQLLHRPWLHRHHTEVVLRSRRLPLYQSPVRLMVLLAASIFFGETCVMLLLAHFPELPTGAEALLDSAMLIVIVLPTLYFFLFRPFTLHLQRQQQTEEEIRGLSRRLMAVTDEERKKVAMDLHDHFGQVLTGLQFGLESLNAGLAERRAPENPQASELLTLARHLGDDVRSYASCLRPTLIDDLGLVPTLEWYLAELGRQHPDLGIDFRKFGLRRQSPPVVAEALFRVCQEALNNVIKHAGARHVEVALVHSHPWLILTVRDDGVGFAPVSLDGLRGIGLWSMRERAALAGGTLQIVSRPGAGTTVRAELPMPGGIRDDGEE
jgi:signal transduction histidine kinase